MLGCLCTEHTIFEVTCAHECLPAPFSVKVILYTWLFLQWFYFTWISRVRPHKNFHFNIWLSIVMKTSQNRKIKPLRIPQPSPKSQKYMYAKYLSYTVNTISQNHEGATECAQQVNYLWFTGNCFQNSTIWLSTDDTYLQQRTNLVLRTNVQMFCTLYTNLYNCLYLCNYRNIAFCSHFKWNKVEIISVCNTTTVFSTSIHSFRFNIFLFLATNTFLLLLFKYIILFSFLRQYIVLIRFDHFLLASRQ